MSHFLVPIFLRSHFFEVTFFEVTFVRSRWELETVQDKLLFASNPSAMNHSMMSWLSLILENPQQTGLFYEQFFCNKVFFLKWDCPLLELINGIVVMEVDQGGTISCQQDPNLLYNPFIRILGFYFYITLSFWLFNCLYFSIVGPKS